MQPRMVQCLPSHNTFMLNHRTQRKRQCYSLKLSRAPNLVNLWIDTKIATVSNRGRLKNTNLSLIQIKQTKEVGVNKEQSKPLPKLLCFCSPCSTPALPHQLILRNIHKQKTLNRFLILTQLTAGWTKPMLSHYRLSHVKSIHLVWRRLAKNGQPLISHKKTIVF